MDMGMIVFVIWFMVMVMVVVVMVLVVMGTLAWAVAQFLEDR